jgi:hypothetical protein
MAACPKCSTASLALTTVVHSIASIMVLHDSCSQGCEPRMLSITSRKKEAMTLTRVDDSSPVRAPL